ncbi:MAG TPA: hypothetical protein PKA00_17310 [Saprospiraceae bacterium]|nr:hypothetical protein [Saprospiraceae bacterium]HMQ84679.1 hypothetical protein [Saprospiraceae bacterium]
MESKSRIGNLNYIKGIDLVELKEDAGIGRFNFITGFPSNYNSSFGHLIGRKAELVLGKSSSITMRHYIDCTCGVYLGEFALVAGLGTQFLSHSIDLKENKQSGEKVEIGNYSFVGSACILLPGTKLPDFSMLGAGSVLAHSFGDSDSLYSGVPAKKVKSLVREEYSFFKRTIGFVK